MSKHYYLMNGKNGIGNAIDLVVDGKRKRQFNDIAELDFRTLDIKNDLAKEYLSEFNPKENLNGMFYDVQYPFKKTEVKSFGTMFKYDNDKTKSIEDKFKYFAEERMYYVMGGEKVKLYEGEKLDEYIKTILYDILSNEKSSILDFDSIMSASLKTLLFRRYNEYYNKGTMEFMKANIYRLRNQLSNYSELRNLTMEYLLWKQGLNTNLRNKIKSKENYDNYGMTDVNSEIIMPKTYKQMEIYDFIKDPKIKLKKY